MANVSAEALIAAFDQSPLNRRYWTIFGLLAIGSVLAPWRKRRAISSR